MWEGRTDEVAGRRVDVVETELPAITSVDIVPLVSLASPYPSVLVSNARKPVSNVSCEAVPSPKCGEAVTSPKSGGAVSSPKSGGAVTSPKSGGAVTSPKCGGAVP